MQTITTKVFGPTNTQGQRVKAKCAAGQLTMAWEYAVGHEQNHRMAAEALRNKLGWPYLMVSGIDHKGDGQHVLLSDRYAIKSDRTGFRKYRPTQLEYVREALEQQTESNNPVTTFKVGDSKHMNINLNTLVALIDLFNQNDSE